MGGGIFRRALDGLARRRRRRSPRGVALCHHRVTGPHLDPAQLDVSTEIFDAQLAVLVRDGHPLAIDEFEARRREGTLPERAVVVTFDDGYADNLHTVLPLCEARGVPFTVFVTTDGIGNVEEYWWDALERACYAAHELPATLTVAGETIALDAAARAPRDATSMKADDARWPLYRRLSLRLRQLPAPDRTAAVRELAAWAGVPSLAREARRTLTIEELQRLAASPLVTIGAHSVSHPVLGLLGADEMVAEVRQSRDQLGAWLGAPPKHFAYPFGEGAAVTPAAESVVAAAGFATGFTTDARPAWRGDRSTAVPRFAMLPWDAAPFATRFAGWFDL